MVDLGDAWLAAMRRGDFAAAWAISDIVLAGRDPAQADDPALPYHLRWVWTGAPLDGREVLVRCYHGLGDTLQFVRLLAMLRPRVAGITLELQPELLGVLGGVAGVDRMIGFRPEAPTPVAEGAVAVELMEVAHALRLDWRDLPGTLPVVRCVPAPRGPGLRVGLCWAAGAWSPERSVPLESLAAAVPAGAVLVSLQRGPAAEDALAIGAPAFANPHDRSTDMAATAGLIASCDVVVSVDTAVAHLAGTMGCSTRLLLRHDADWRWMTGHAQQPWYPSMRLLRQLSPGDWTAPLALLERDFKGSAFDAVERQRSPS